MNYAPYWHTFVKSANTKLLEPNVRLRLKVYYWQLRRAKSPAAKNSQPSYLLVCTVFLSASAQNQRFAPLRCPNTSRFPHHPLVVAVLKNRTSLFPCACGRFILFTHFISGTAFVPHCHPPFTPLRLVHFTHLSTAQHRWLSRSIPQSTQSFHFAFRP